MTEKEENRTTVYSYQVNMLVHIVADTPDAARLKLDEQGGIVTKRDVELVHSVALYGEKESD
jgi:hypothetical protein